MVTLLLLIRLFSVLLPFRLPYRWIRQMGFVLLAGYGLAGRLAAQPLAEAEAEAAVPTPAPAAGSSGFTGPVAERYTRVDDGPRSLEALFPGVRGDWARATLQGMSLEEKIGQLFMVPAFTRQPTYNRRLVETLIRKYKVGGIIFMQGGPMAQVQHANLYQRMADVPLLVGQDAEWGLSMRLDSVLGFPKNMTLGAIRNDSLLYQFGKQMAFQCRAVGVHVNFAPVVDVNNNPRNPVINDRSFGEDKHAVARKALMVMQGLQENGVIACAKHFPGHGDTDTDSHLDLPAIAHSARRMDSLELYPFRQLIREGIKSVMVAHLFVPALDTTSGRPTTVSPNIVQGILRQAMSFHGLVFTDALNMKGLTKYYPPGQAELAALLAGNDILLFPENVPVAVEVIKQAVFDSVLTEAELDQHVYRILLAKEWLGLHKRREVPEELARTTIANPTVETLRTELYRASVTLAQNPHGELPLADVSHRMAYVQLGYDAPAPYFHALKKYGPVDFFLLPKDASDIEIKTLLRQLDPYGTVLVGLLQMTRRAELLYGIPRPTQDLLCYLRKTDKRVAVAAFGNPYSLQYIPEGVALLVSYDESVEAQIAAAEAVFGGRVPTGHLPVTAMGRKKLPPPAYDTRIRRFALGPDAAQVARVAALGQIDTLVYRAIGQKAMPGATVMVLQGDRIVYDRGFGYTDYQKSRYADPYTMAYDVASVTKVAATTLMAMRLYEQERLPLDAPIGNYLPELAGSDKTGIRIRHLLQHDSGLPPYLPFWKQVVRTDGRGVDSVWLRRQPAPGFTVQVTDSLWLHESFGERIWLEIARTPLLSEPGEKVAYSDLGLILLSRILERIAGERMEFYLQRHFYRPLGMNNTHFTPALKCLPEPPTPGAVYFPPTEEDANFRFGRVQGWVNDEAAALLGGYAGNAGLFSNTYDLAKLLLMLKNGGSYGGRRYLKPETVALFTQSSTKGRRRGLGWDKPETQSGKPSPAGDGASGLAYGHLGFTGTCVWVDPKADLVYILLSNRTYPDPENTRFNELSVRTRVMEAVYRTLGEPLIGAR